METFRLETSQNVALEYSIASIGDRILAYFLDALFASVYFILLVSIFSSNIFNLNIWSIFLLLPVGFYHFIFETFFNGYSPGKMIMQIRVFKADGSQLTIGSCFIRWIFRLIDITMFMGGIAVLVLIINGKGQRLGDLVASTTVLRVPRKAGLEQTSWMQVDENYEVQFYQVELLSDKDIRIIREVLDVSSKHSDALTSFKLLKEAREAIEVKTSIRSDLSDREFLRTIIKDYNAFHLAR